MHPYRAAASDAPPAARRIVVAIPARWGSTRLPGKVLRPLAGRPMVEHVYRRAQAAPDVASVVVLTDDERVAGAVEAFGGRCEMTPPECASGTDRIAWAARRWSDVDGVVNVQGDEPLIDPRGIGAVARHLASFPDDPVVTLACPAAEDDRSRPEVVKVVVDRRGYALYFSRAPIPFPRSEGHVQPLRHLGIYGYQREALERLAALPQTPLERTESLEQLRALENGIPIRVLSAREPSLGVDTEEDVARVERRLRELAEGPAAAGEDRSRVSTSHRLQDL